MIHLPSASAGDQSSFNRRQFLQTAGAAGVAGTLAGTIIGTATGTLAGEEQPAKPVEKTGSDSEPETLVKKLYETITPEQKKQICFAWDHTDERGLLRTHVSNNWHITKPTVGSDFFTPEQRDIIEALFYGLYAPDWHASLKKQLQDDAGGYGKAQNIAIFGEPGAGKFELVMTGRHLTIRCDGDSTEHTAFGGPIFYGHAAQGFNEKADHPGNVYWHQALQANKLFGVLDGKQQSVALIERQPDEGAVHFRGKTGGFPGLPVSELSADQKEHLTGILKTLVAPYRAKDQQEVHRCLEAQGGLAKCSLAFYQEGDIGGDKVWDNWRLEGPSFVWYFRGSPHVHVWVNIADDPSVQITTRG